MVRSIPYARLRTVPDVQLTLMDTRGQECRPTVWLDGRRADVSAILAIRAKDVLSLEVMRMRGEVPIEYQEFSNCGAVLIWLRPASLGY